MISFDRNMLEKAALRGALGIGLAFFAIADDVPLVFRLTSALGALYAFTTAGVYVYHVGRFNGWWRLRP